MSLPEPLAALVIDQPDTPRRVFAGVDPTAVTYLRANSKEDMEAAFVAAGIELYGSNFDWLAVGMSAAPDVLGVIHNDDVVYGPNDDDGVPTVISGPTPKSGYHVNVLVVP